MKQHGLDRNNTNPLPIVNLNVWGIFTRRNWIVYWFHSDAPRGYVLQQDLDCPGNEIGTPLSESDVAKCSELCNAQVECVTFMLIIQSDGFYDCVMKHFCETTIEKYGSYMYKQGTLYYFKVPFKGKSNCFCHVILACM